MTVTLICLTCSKVGVATERSRARGPHIRVRKAAWFNAIAISIAELNNSSPSPGESVTIPPFACDPPC
jgi:hypothetical protein